MERGASLGQKLSVQDAAYVSTRREWEALPAQVTLARDIWEGHSPSPRLLGGLQA